MESFYSRIQNLFSEVITKNDAIIDLVEQFQKNSDTEFLRLLDAEKVAKNDAIRNLEDKNTELMAKVSSYETAKLGLAKQVEDLEFEVKNLKSVSLLSQADKYSRTLQIKIDELEKKLRISETKCKTLEERLTSVANPVLPVSPVPAKNVEAEITEAISNVEPPVIIMTRCYARVGADKIAADSLTVEEISQYPSDSYKSKSGKYIGRPCTKLVAEVGQTFCTEHSDGFSDIRHEPSDAEKPKKKKKGVAATEEPKSDPLLNCPASVTVRVDIPSEPVIEPQPWATTKVETTNSVVSDEAVSSPIPQVEEKESKKSKKPKKTDDEKGEKKSKKKKADNTESGNTVTEDAKLEARSPPKSKKYKLEPADPKIKSPAKPDWGFIEPWDEPDTGIQYIVDTKTGLVFEATESGDIGGFTGFSRV